MNNDIRTLALKAGMEDYPDYGVNALYGEETISKFAELLIQECVGMLRREGELGKTQLIAGPSGTYKLAFMNEAANMIEARFK